MAPACDEYILTQIRNRKYLHDEMLLPMARCSSAQSPVLQVTALADPALPEGSYAADSLVDIQMVLLILSNTHTQISKSQLYKFLCFIGCYLLSHDRNKYQVQKLPHTIITNGSFRATDPGHYDTTKMGCDLDLK